VRRETDTSGHPIALYLAHHSPKRYGGQRRAVDHRLNSMVFLLCMLVNAWCAKLQWKWSERGSARLDLDRMHASLVSSVLVSFLLCSQTKKVTAMESRKEMVLFGGSE
jgi:hypothetical protein